MDSKYKPGMLVTYSKSYKNWAEEAGVWGMLGIIESVDPAFDGYHNRYVFVYFFKARRTEQIQTENMFGEAAVFHIYK